MSRLLPALLFVLSGCASLPETVRELPAGASRIELTQTPFYPQERYQCGPAALATVLDASGVDVTVEELVERVYIPARQGSLQLEMIAATRTQGRVPYVIDGTLAALWRELDAGRPIVVLQNLGIAAIPRWHYAVVVGIEVDRNEVLLRSGTERRRVTPVTTFLRTWRRSDYWAMVALDPAELPANVDRQRYFEAIAALEETGHPEVASTAWRTALERWPGDEIALFGYANTALGLDDLETAEAAFRELLTLQPGLGVARNNLALALAGQGRYAEALTEIDRALADDNDAALTSELEDTRNSILRMQAGETP